MAMKKKGPYNTGNLTASADQPKRGDDYSKDAHGSSFHGGGKAGAAWGARDANSPMDYDRKTFAEGGKHDSVTHGGDEPAKHNLGLAVHHAHPGGGHAAQPHRVGSEGPPARNAHGFGHPAHQRAGVLRNSGHKGAHRVGRR